jgi:hypothetical protein
MGRGRSAPWTASLPVDASGEVTATSDINGPFVGADGAEPAPRRPGRTCASCVARQWFRFSLGRMDADELDVVLRNERARAAHSPTPGTTTCAALVHEVVLSDAFRYRRSAEQSAVITEGE